MRVLLVKLLSTIFVVLFLVKHVLKNYPRDFILWGLLVNMNLLLSYFMRNLTFILSSCVAER